MKLLLCLLPLAAILAACGSDPSPADPPVALRPAIHGSVKTADSLPVAGLRVALLFDVESGGSGDTASSAPIVLPSPVDRMMEIQFEVPAPDSVRVDIVRAYDSAVVTNLVSAVLAPGSHVVSYDAFALPNLVYRVRLKIGGRTLWRTFLLNSPQLDSIRGVTRTGADGGFVIEYSWLQLGTRLTTMFENGTIGGPITIGDSLSVLVERPASTPMIWRIKVDTTAAASARFTIE